MFFGTKLFPGEWVIKETFMVKKLLKLKFKCEVVIKIWDGQPKKGFIIRGTTV